MRGHINIEPTETTSGDRNALNLAIIRDDGHVIKHTGTIEAATNTGSLLLWGSSAYPRMDRADAVSTGALPDTRRMLVVGHAHTGDDTVYSAGEPHPDFPGVKVWNFMSDAGVR